LSRDLWKTLLGAKAPDPGCEACFEVLDRYAEALLAGRQVEELFPEVVAHLESCVACREDTEGLLAALGAADDSSPTPR
jgi:hypothetical protein